VTREQLDFRRVMGHLPTGVTIVASKGPDAERCGLTANSVASVSLQPLLVLVCVARSAASHACICEGGSFAISVLSSDDETLARRFATGPWNERFDGVETRTEVTGSPILQGSLAWLDCRVRDIHEAGDHSIVVGEVLACGAREGTPLLFFRGSYHRPLE
jgi:flavin reductase (DIM6/NTAB) family NADH-FMN oxidoreductase RutF